MQSTTTTVKKREIPRRAGRVLRAEQSPGPLSVPLPPELRARLETVAKKRNLKMATAARVLLDERVREIEDADLLSQVEEWQRAQAWATWEKIKAGDREDVPMERFQEHTERALARLSAKPRKR